VSSHLVLGLCLRVGSALHRTVLFYSLWLLFIESRWLRPPFGPRKSSYPAGHKLRSSVLVALPRYSPPRSRAQDAHPATYRFSDAI